MQSKNVEEVISVANEMERIMSQLIKTKGSQSVNQNWLGYRDSMAGIRSVADSFRELRQCDVIQKEYQKITSKKSDLNAFDILLKGLKIIEKFENFTK